MKRKADEIDRDYPGLEKLIDDMFETMYNSSGVGLAAPQIGLSIRLFIIDGGPFEDDEVSDFKQVFINPQISEEQGDNWKFNEGCLSIPNIREDVSRKQTLKIRYFDRNWEQKEEEYSGLAARIIQHEYDHIEGILFTDRISPLRRRLLKNKLADISSGKVSVDYKMKFPLLRR